MNAKRTFSHGNRDFHLLNHASGGESDQRTVTFETSGCGSRRSQVRGSTRPQD